MTMTMPGMGRANYTSAVRDAGNGDLSTWMNVQGHVTPNVNGQIMFTAQPGSTQAGVDTDVGENPLVLDYLEASVTADLAGTDPWWFFGITDDLGNMAGFEYEDGAITPCDETNGTANFPDGITLTPTPHETVYLAMATSAEAQTRYGEIAPLPASLYMYTSINGTEWVRRFAGPLPMVASSCQITFTTSNGGGTSNFYLSKVNLLTLYGVEPMFDQSFEDLWNDEIPEVYRLADQDQNWQLKRWLGNGPGYLYAGASRLYERWLYVRPNDRELRHITPPPSGAQYRSMPSDLTFDDPKSWTEGMYKGCTVFTLNINTDGAFVRYSPYLQGGMYQLQFCYQPKPENGIFTVVVNGVDIATVVLATSPDDILYSYSIDFYAPRGYASIKLRFDKIVQTSVTHRVNVGDFMLVNTSTGYEYDTSDLVNPYAADAEWLPWIGRMFGVRLNQALSIEDQRDSITIAYTGMNAGTRKALAAAVQPFLTASKFVTIYDHSTSAGIGLGGQWDILIITRESETPAGIDLPALVTASGAKPAGVILHQKTFRASWNAALAQYPHWQDWEAVHWRQIEEAGLS